MKILFYNHTGQVSGAERVLLMILARIDRDSFKPIMVCPDHDSLSDLVSRLGVPVEIVAGLEARFTWQVSDLARYCKSFFHVLGQLRARVAVIKPDLIHANSIRAGLVATAATFGLGTRVVWHLHDLLPQHPLSTLIRLFALLSARTRMIAVSEAVASNFSGRFARRLKSRIVVILNAIDPDKFLPDPTATRRIRKELRIRETDQLIGIVGEEIAAKIERGIGGEASHRHRERNEIPIIAASYLHSASFALLLPAPWVRLWRDGLCFVEGGAGLASAGLILGYIFGVLSLLGCAAWVALIGFAASHPNVFITPTP